MEIYRHDLPDILQYLPAIVPFDDAQEWDLVICNLGFEDRSHAIIDRIVLKRDRRKTTLLLVRYPTNHKENKLNERFFTSAGGRMAACRTITYSRKEYPALLAEALESLLPVEGSRVIFDISSCSSYAFYPTMRELLKRNISLTIGYAEADTYFPTEEEWSNVASKAQTEESLFIQSFENAGFQSLGVEDIYPYPLFSEMNPGNRPGILIAVPNFSVMRTSAIRTRDREINNTSYEGVYWVIGVPPGDKNKWRMEALRATHSLPNTPNARMIDVSTFDYKEMLKALEDTWLNNRHKSYMSVGPLGSKMQHVGTFLFLYLHQDVGLWLAEPKEFRASRFSTGLGSIWQIPIGETTSLKEKLDTYMTFTWKF